MQSRLFPLWASVVRATYINLVKNDEKTRKLLLKFIYSKKATKFCEISTLLLTGTTQDKSKVEFPQNFVAFSEYINFTKEGREDYSENLFP